MLKGEIFASHRYLPVHQLGLQTTKEERTSTNPSALSVQQLQVLLRLDLILLEHLLAHLPKKSLSASLLRRARSALMWRCKGF